MPDISGMAMPGMDMSAAPSEPISSTVEFPYGFPSPGRYRIFIQMKHANTVEAGVFDAEAHQFRDTSMPPPECRSSTAPGGAEYCRKARYRLPICLQ